MDRIERSISKLLVPSLATYGFALAKERHCFIKFTDYGFDNFMVINKGRIDNDYYGVSCAIGIRHDKVQLPFNSLGFIHGDEAQQENTTLVLRYPSYSWGRPFEYLKLYSTSPEDIAKMTDEIANVFVEQALSFYQRFSQLCEIEELLNKEPMEDISPYSGGFFPEDRVVTSLLCAKAVNPARYDMVKEAFVKKNQGTWPLEKRMEILKKIDEIKI